MSDVRPVATPGVRRFGPVTLTDIVRYQGASGDLNPLHHDAEFARSAGLPRPVSVGMLQAGWAATYATDWLGAAHIRRFAVRFKAPTWPGDVVAYEGEVVGTREDPSGAPLLDVRITGTTHSGVVIVADASFATHTR